jgi:predicted PhzF superfamily epimerase YddE/YHI9
VKRGEIRGLGISPVATAKARDYLAIFDTERAVRELRPDMTALMHLDCPGIIVTAPGDDCDFVSRFFAPRAGVPEYPVTGSAHC